MSHLWSSPSFPAQGHHTLYGVPDGFNSFALVALAQQYFGRPVFYVCSHEIRAVQLAQELSELAPEIEVLSLPAWDCLPYDRVSPRKDILGRRVQTLSALLAPQTGPRIVLTTVRSFFQRVPPHDLYQKTSFTVTKGQALDFKALESYLIAHGFNAVTTVREPGEFSKRGGIIDFFPASHETPYRLDLFGEEVEELKTFDPLTQRSSTPLDQLSLSPVNEILLNDQTIHQFRQSYRRLFGTVGEQDPLYQAISAHRFYAGAEHWLPLFYPSMDTVLEYVQNPLVCFDLRASEAAEKRLDQIQEYYNARVQFKSTDKSKAGHVYHPIPPELLYPTLTEMQQKLSSLTVFHFSPFAAASSDQIDLGTRSIPDFSAARQQPDAYLVDYLKQRIAAAQAQGKKVIICNLTSKSQAQMAKLLREGDLSSQILAQWGDSDALLSSHVGLILRSLDFGFETATTVVITEQDIFGSRQRKAAKRQRRSDLFIGEASALHDGDYVVHQEHGIGHFKGLITLTVGEVSHDCVALMYAGGDKLFLPVENLEILSRYGGESSLATLDKLGSSAWQLRKAKIKKRLQEIAHYLIKLAAERQLHKADIFECPENLYQAFVARFPYQETEDQARVIEETLEDLKTGKPMDRLVCGDVGFGKTEVALRAAFAVAVSGQQVAVIVPTTLLCRQHFRNFQERFEGFGLNVQQLSRLVSPKDAKKIKEDLGKGQVDIAIGTHSLLSQSLEFKKLGLVIVDEEQHFGVKQKERLKILQKDVHLLTLSATPIPRTLQMALSGVRDLSLITTPPVDRLAVRTFVLPYDGVVIREAIQRELYRGGQLFYVSPRIEDLEMLSERLKALVPEARTVMAHGQLAATALEEVMNDFYDKKYDILLSTHIIESGLDMPSVNTIIIHRADLFGLAQLYQLRGRVGRAKARGYAYLTLPEMKTASVDAQKRLEVMQTLDTLGAGFQLASHDMDIRGAGNLLGEEQSGHIREVGVELYQQMLEEAIQEVRSQSLGKTAAPAPWSPQLNLGLSIMIPEAYIQDLAVRLSLYRRLSSLETEEEILNFQEELIDRFGPLPPEVDNLLAVLQLKQLCRQAHIEKVDVGEKGCIFAFHTSMTLDPALLMNYIAASRGTLRLRADQKLIALRVWTTPHQKVEGVRKILEELIALEP